MYWIEHVTTLFRKVPDLKAVTFTGLHNDAEVLRIAVNRQQFDSEFSGLQETIAAHSAITFQSLGMGKATRQGRREGAGGLQAEDLPGRAGELPKAQVTIVKDLADGKMGKPPAAEKPAGGKGKKARRSSERRRPKTGLARAPAAPIAAGDLSGGWAPAGACASAGLVAAIDRVPCAGRSAL